MSSYKTNVAYPVPVAWVSQAAIQAAAQVGMSIKAQSPNYVKFGSGLTLMTYPVTLELWITGVDGNAQISVAAHNFGWGPLQTGACRDKAEQVMNFTAVILQGWSRQATTTPPPPPASS